MKKRAVLISLIVILLIFTIVFTGKFSNTEENNLQNIDTNLSGYTDFNEEIDIDDSNINEENSIFVSNDGQDGDNNGTENSPYNTINYAISKAKPGQTIYLRAGTYNELIDFEESGEENNPITLRNYPGENVIISGANIDEADTVIDLNNCSNINIIGLKIQDIQEIEDWSAYGILFRGGNKNCIISDCEFTNIRANGRNGNASPITLWGETEESISNVLIQNNYIHDCECGWSEGIAVTGNCEYIDIIGNTIHDTKNIGIDIQGNYGVCSNSALDHGRYVYVSQNHTYNCVSPIAESAGIYVDGASNVIIERNISHDNTLGIEIGTENEAESDEYYANNNLIINNLVYNNTSMGIEIGGYDEGVGKIFNTKVYNNTVIHPQTATSSALCVQIGEGYDIKNNIFADYGTWNLLVTSNDFDNSLVKDVNFENNLLYHANSNEIGRYIQVAGTRYNTDEFNAQSFAKNNILEKNPNLTDDYRLQDSSPAVATGVYTEEIVSYPDLDGKYRVSVVDMGCYVYTLSQGVDKSELKEVIDSVNNYTSSDYTEDTWNKVQEELEKAQAVYDNPSATEDEVNNAKTNLQQALENLVLDKTGLKDAIDSVNDYTSSDYTEDTWNKVKEELEKAQDIYNNPNATKQEIIEAENNLEQALNDLAKRKGSITIIVHEQQNGDTTTNSPLKGVEYTIYKVDESCESKWDAERYVEDNQVEGISKTTGEDGTIVYDNLELGRYYAVATSLPDGVGYTEGDLDFVVDIPMTNMDGTGWDYDITVEPKIQTAYGNLELTKVDGAGNPIEGVTFKVQVMKQTSYNSLEDLERNVWTDYIPEGEDSVLTVTTNNEGKIRLNNLPAYVKIGAGYRERVYYRLVEMNAPNGYIINNGVLSTLLFGVDYDGTVYGILSNGVDNLELGNLQSSIIKNVSITPDLTSFTLVNEKPNIVKEVKNSEGEFVDSIGANVTDKLTFKITADVPMQIAYMDTYKITDELPEGIVLDKNSIKVEGTTTDGSETIPEDMYTLSTDGLELTFDTSKMYNIMYDDYLEMCESTPKYSNIIITYEATIDKNNVVIGGNGNINTATLEYTNNIETEYDEYGEPIGPVEISTTTVSDTAQVHTGAVLLEKVEKGNVSTKLAGAKFKIATTKENAEDGIFVKDETGADIEVTTGENGQAIIEGLKYADDGTDTSYWLVETQAPSYVEDGVTKYYNLLKAPVEVMVGKTTHQSAVQIENGKGFELPETGSIGLAIFTVVGVAVMIGAVVLNKKQKVQE